MKNRSIHPLSDVQTAKIGEGTRIWQFCVILPDAVLGEDCNICAHVFIEGDVVVGDRVTIKSGVQLWDGLRISDDVFIGPNVTFTNDRFPRSRQKPEKFLLTTVCRGASIGANASILPGIRVGEDSMIGAGAVVTSDVPPNAIVAGNPARIIGYANVQRSPIAFGLQDPGFKLEDLVKLGVGDSCLYRLPLIEDIRGSLSVGEVSKQIPFNVKRVFWVFGVPSKEVRGEHAHKKLHQYLICVKGSVSIVLDDGKQSKEVLLAEPNLGLHIPPGVWGVQYKYSADAVLIVMASDVYDSDDYIRNYAEFQRFISKKSAP